MKLEKNIVEVKRENDVYIFNLENGRKLKTNLNYYTFLQDNFASLINNFRDWEGKLTKIQMQNLENLIKAMKQANLIYQDKAKENLNSVVILTTNNCNLRCRHCINESGLKNCNELSTTELLRVVEGVEELKADKLTLSGGEFLIRDNALAELQMIRNIFSGKIILATNSLLINETNVEMILANIDSIDISLDGVDEYTTSLVRGKGVFTHVIKTIKLIQSFNFNKIAVSMVLVGENLKNRDKFIALCKELGVKPLCRRFSPGGRGESKENIKMIKQSNTMQKIEVSNIRKCKAGIREFLITDQGEVYPCPLFMNKKHLLGNVREDNIINIYQRTLENEEKDQKRYYYNKECKACDYRALCWNCSGFYNQLIESGISAELCAQRKKFFREHDKYVFD